MEAKSKYDCIDKSILTLYGEEMKRECETLSEIQRQLDQKCSDYVLDPNIMRKWEHKISLLSGSRRKEANIVLQKLKAYISQCFHKDVMIFAKKENKSLVVVQASSKWNKTEMKSYLDKRLKGKYVERSATLPVISHEEILREQSKTETHLSSDLLHESDTFW